MNSSILLVLFLLFLLLTALFLWLFVSNLLQKNGLKTALEAKETELRTVLEAKETELRNAESRHAGELEAEGGKLRAVEDRCRRELELKDEALKVQKETFEAQTKALEDRFKALSEEITRKRAEELNKSNRETMDGIVTPLKETISKMEKALKENRESDAKRAGELEQTIREMAAKSSEVGRKADALAEALRAKPKLQGNWGEEQLRRLLDLENFTEGVHYDVQETLKGEEGNNLRPDFILHFPDDKDIIIDSKVSLTAFTSYVEAETDEEKEAFARENLRSIKKHIGELRDKKYQKLVKAPRQALEYAVMFVPNEMAIQLAYQVQPDLWQEAIDSGVFLASQQNLMVLLRMIRLSWTQDAQMKNYRELTKHASLLIDRSEKLVEELDKVHASIRSLDSNFTAVENRIKGRVGILTSARKISELSGKPSTELAAATDPD